MIVAKDIILRDFIESDIEKRIYWEKVETEWQLWDAPWEYEGLTEEEKEREFQSYVDVLHKKLEYNRNISEDEKRYSFQIMTNDDEQKYIGWVSSYDIDEDYTYTEESGYRAVGIDIPDMSARGKGYAYQALGSFIQYLLEHGDDEIYIQTWSGNERMIHIAEKMGFEECRRKVGIRSVRGEIYDGLTFKLNKDKFSGFNRIMSKHEIIEMLKDKNDKTAYEFTKKIVAKSAETNEYYMLFDAFIEMISDKKSYVRTRGFCLACAQARWDDEDRISASLDKMCVLLNDVKPTVVRQCLAALHEVVLFRPELADRICKAIKGIDLSRYKESMAPLIKKDADELLKMLE